MRADRCCTVALAALLLSAAAFAAEPQTPAQRAVQAKPKPKPAPLTLYLPTAWPEALPRKRATDIKFTVLVAGGAAKPRPEVSLQIRGLDRDVRMHDDGKGPDLSAGDRIYSAVVRLDPAKAPAGGCFSVRARARSGARTVLSGERRVCATRFPVGIAASDFSKANVIVFGQGREAGPVVADEALIGVSPNLDDDRIAAIAALVDGTVAGSARSQNVYQIRLRTTQTLEGLQQTLARLQKVGGVRFAVPNAIGGLQTPPVVPVTTSDPMLASQANLDRIRARHAWAITTGDAAQLIAVIDTGADFDHPDFWATPTGTATRFATSGANLVAADCAGASCVAVAKPTTCHATNVCNAANAAVDTYGHGTVVAGFVGAATNNALGIAGPTWQGQLLVVRFAANDATASSAKLLDGINHASAEGARIISISYANPIPFVGTILCPAVATAEIAGRLVVAAAGNDGGTGVNYPAGCTCGVGATCPVPALAGTPTAMPVANSEVSAGLDVIHTGTLPSNLGTWISLAAPGTTVLSTARDPVACATATTNCDPAYVSDPLTPGYRAVIGTSFSAPLAAGAAALVLARSPSTTNADLRSLLFSTGVPLQAPAAHIRRIDVLAALLTFNTAPTAVNLSGGGPCIPENTNTTGGLTVGTLTTVDADAGSTGFEYTISGPDAVKFAPPGGPNLDQLILTDGILNFETKPSYSITVTTTDVGGASFPEPLVVSVCDVNDPPTGLPVISGIPTENQTLTAVTAAIADEDGLGPFSYQWLRGGVSIPGATSSTYVLDDPDVGQLISVRVTYTDGGGTPESLTSAATAPIVNVNDPPTGFPTISGTLTVGQTLTAITGAIADADGLGTFSYQWLRGVANIPGATGNTYVLVGADIGTVTNVRVSYTDGHGTVETLTTVNATNTGDPHITTVDGLHYDFQSAGEFVTLRGANGMEIQTRQTAVSTGGALTDPYSGLSVGVSINTAVAARVGTHRVTFQPNISGLPASSPLELRVDGVLTTLPAGGIVLGAGARVVPLPGGPIQIDFPDATTMVVTPSYWPTNSVWWLNISIFHTSAHEGIMGARDASSWLPKLADGTSLGAMPAALHDRYVDLYQKFANSWRVKKETSLFDYAQGTSTGTFTLASWPPENPPFVVPPVGNVVKPVNKPINKQLAQQQCRAVVGKNQNADCVFDVMVAGNLGFARSYLREQRIQSGLTAIVLRDDRKTAKPREPVTFTATVVKSAVLAGVVQSSVDRKSKPRGPVIPTGTVQFTLDGKNVGKPVPLDAKGQARVRISRTQLGTRRLAARYLPTKDSVFLASRSLEEPRKVTERKD